MNEYEELMARYDAIRAAWMERVERDREVAGTATFYGAGAILSRDGGLRMTAHRHSDGRPVWELTIAPGQTEVAVQHA